jgi:predicted transcriptional regulator
MEPDVILPLRDSYKEYEDLGKKHRTVTARIETLQQKMRESRISGAFKQLQQQMTEVKSLVKEKEKLDADMSVLDLARKKQDDFNLARKVEVSYSEELNSVESKIEKLQDSFASFSESLGLSKGR